MKLPKKLWIISIDWKSEWNYVWVVSRVVSTWYTEKYSDKFDVTHLHFCGSSSWAKNDCLKWFDWEYCDEFFEWKEWSWYVLEPCHYSSLETIKNHFIKSNTLDHNN